MVSYSQLSRSSSSTHEETTKRKPIPSSIPLRSIQKSSPPSKSSKKTALSEPPPAAKHPQVYKVKPIHFRELVQKLTGAPEFQPPRRLQGVVPPALPLGSHGLPAARGGSDQLPLCEAALPAAAMRQKKESESEAEGPTVGTEGVSLSPSFQTWCTFPLLSPGALSDIEEDPLFNY
ncbi:hypothetical protein Nepgr_008190 [Nepenthes gracilis]|uniref:VQ domain-containing protein n=1 Tax=Nepenthes gracilis TaxID=150966 RepID=A0AAD3S8A5_NEPGR|nr:hypothetical protein Nepgr_008190 [Nepenthes gracilis]